MCHFYYYVYNRRMYIHKYASDQLLYYRATVRMIYEKNDRFICINHQTKNIACDVVDVCVPIC